MDFKETAYSILIVSAADKFNASLRELLPDFKYYSVKFQTSISAAKRALLEREYDFVMISSPLPDGDGVRFAIDICSQKNTVVLLLVRAELYASVFDQVSRHGVYLLPKPTSKQIMTQALDWMTSTRERLRKIARKTVSLEDKMQEIRIVNRAKWLLISELKMSEEEAHKYIEKQAMDRCVPKRDVAESIIKTYS